MKTIASLKTSSMMTFFTKPGFALSFAVFVAMLVPRNHAGEVTALDPFSLRPDETVTVTLPSVAPAAAATFARLPLSFVRNDGQADPATKFELRGRGYLLSLEQNELVMALGNRKAEGCGVRRPSAALLSPATTEVDATLTSGTDPKAPEAWRSPRPVGFSVAPNQAATQFHALRMKLVGAHSNAVITGEYELPGKFNYFIGNDPALWRTNVPSFAKVRYREVYSGIDLVYYGNEGQLEYDFVVEPGADPDQIALAIEGADAVEVDDNGDLRLAVADRELHWRKPKIYQELDGLRVPVAGEYVLRPGVTDQDGVRRYQVAFHVAPYDRMLALVIDPVLSYSTYLGGGLADWAYGVAVDAQGCAYVTGMTWSQNNFPTTTNRIQRIFTVNGAVFVTKFSPAGDKLLYSTVLTGSDYSFGQSEGRAIQVDSDGNAVVVGYTDQGDFPTGNAVQPFYGGGFSAPHHGDAFVTKLSPDGASLVFSTYLGGSSYDRATTVALADQGDVHVAGYTRSTDFPTLNPIQAEHGGGNFDLWVAKFSGSGDSLVYSTYLGDDRGDSGGTVAVDSAGGALVAWNAGGQVRFVRFNPSGTALDLQREKSLVGNAWISFNCLAFDSVGKLVLAGETQSDLLPTSPGAFQPTLAGSSDGFVAKLDPVTSDFEYLTYLGGTDADSPQAITVDTVGNAYVVGTTRSADFPTVDPIQAILKTGPSVEPVDGFVSKLSPDGSRLIWSTYLGGGRAPSTGDGRDTIAAAAIAPDGGMFIAGYTQSSDFPVLNPYQTTLRTESFWMAQDAFVAKIIDPLPPSILITRTGDIVVISWPTSAIGYTLEFAGVLAPAADWQPEPTAPVIIGDQNVVTLEASAAARFFRLHKP